MKKKFNQTKKFFSLPTDKKSYFYLVILLAFFVLALFLIFHFSKIPEIKVFIQEKPKSSPKTLKKVLKNLTAPSATSETPFSPNLLKSITPKNPKLPSLERIIQKLNSPHLK